MASEDNPANSGLSDDNPLADAVERGRNDPTSTLYEGDDGDDSGGSDGGSTGSDSAGGSSESGGPPPGTPGGGPATGQATDSGSADSGRAARLLDGSTGDSSGSSGGAGGSDTPPGFQGPPDTVTTRPTGVGSNE